MTDTLLTALGAVIGAPIGLALALWAPGAIVKRKARREPTERDWAKHDHHETLVPPVLTTPSPRMAYRAALAHKRRALATLDLLRKQVEADARDGSRHRADARGPRKACPTMTAALSHIPRAIKRIGRGARNILGPTRATADADSTDDLLAQFHAADILTREERTGQALAAIKRGDLPDYDDARSLTAWLRSDPHAANHAVRVLAAP